MKKITRETKIGEAIKINPKAAEILFNSGFHCVGCAVASVESIEEGARAHGLSDKEIDKLIKEINEKKSK